MIFVCKYKPDRKTEATLFKEIEKLREKQNTYEDTTLGLLYGTVADNLTYEARKYSVERVTLVRKKKRGC